jgi:hypothetical protein
MNLKMSQSHSNVDTSRKLACFIFKRSISNPNKWLYRHFRWDGECLNYYISEKDMKPKWLVKIDQIVRVTMLTDPVVFDERTHWSLELLLIDGKHIELSHKQKDTIQLWVDSLNLALNAQWMIAYRECVLVPGQGTPMNRKAAIFGRSDDDLFNDVDHYEPFDEASIFSEYEGSSPEHPSFEEDEDYTSSNYNDHPPVLSKSLILEQLMKNIEFEKTQLDPSTPAESKFERTGISLKCSNDDLDHQASSDSLNRLVSVNRLETPLLRSISQKRMEQAKSDDSLKKFSREGSQKNLLRSKSGSKGSINAPPITAPILSLKDLVNGLNSHQIYYQATWNPA